MRVDPVPNWVAAAGTGGENPQENGNGCDRRGRKRTQNEDVNQNINLCEAVGGGGGVREVKKKIKAVKRSLFGNGIIKS